MAAEDCTTKDSGPKAGWGTPRRARRFQLDIRLKCNLPDRGPNAQVLGRGSDLSEYGMAAYIPLELSLGDILHVEVTLPYTKTPSRLPVIVRNRSGFRYGLEFHRLDEAQRELIHRTCKTLSLVS